VIPENQALHNPNNPRHEIEEAIVTGDLLKLLTMSGLLHGHFCPFLAIGVKASARALKELGVSSAGMEEVIAIVETNSCFSDGVQFVTGCSFGNNALIYRDFGKTAFTLAKRNGDALRITVKADSRFLAEHEPQAAELFRKVVTERRGTEADQRSLSELWRQSAFKMLAVPDDELFDVNRVTVKVPAYARIFASVKCSVCGESVMEPCARIRDGKPVCISCSGHEYYQLTGDGMSVIKNMDSAEEKRAD
jgi:formylmethanofuran dehydrogenase subunit E